MRLRLATRCLHAADESGGNIAKKFEQLGVQDTAENRIAYRGAMITTAGYSEIIGGVILFDETFRQSYEGKTVTDILRQQGVVIGVKVDSGLQPFGNSKIEQVGKNELAALSKRWRSMRRKTCDLPSSGLLAISAVKTGKIFRVMNVSRPMPQCWPNMRKSATVSVSFLSSSPKYRWRANTLWRIASRRRRVF